MSDHEQTVIIVDGPDAERVARISRRILGGSHIVLIMAAAEAFSRAAEALSLISHLPHFSMPVDMVLPAAANSEIARRDYEGARHFTTGNRLQFRQQQFNLAAQYSNAAKWSGQSCHTQHRSRENRHAERQRNWAAFNR
jgi:hypothetical protein